MAEQQPLLDEVFSGILNDQALQEQVKEAEKQQKRLEEKEKFKPVVNIGREYYLATLDPQRILSEELKVQAESLERFSGIDRPPPNPSGNTGQPPAQVYLGRAVKKIDQAGRYAGQERELHEDSKYFLYGFGMAALENGDVNTALIALSYGEWFEDEFEGQEIQRNIAEKVATLDPKAKVDAAMTWKKIQEAKVPAPAQPPPTP